jgi:hypothetical protein
MVRWILLAVLVVALTATATVVVQGLPSEMTKPGSGPAYPAVPAGEKGARPLAVVDDDLTYHFGKRAQHTKFSKEWVIKNRGKADLTLELEAPPCSCTVGGFQNEKGEMTGTKEVVKPGGQKPIKFTWDTRENSGKYVKEASLLTNDPEHPKIVFTADGEVNPAVVVYPPTMSRSVDFFEVTTDEPEHTLKFAMYSPDRSELKITKLRSSKPNLIVADDTAMPEELCKQLNVKSGRQITVKVLRGLPLGVFLEELVIGTDHPLQPEVRLTVTGKVVGPITMVPERLRLFSADNHAGQVGSITLLVRGQKETHFKVKKKPEHFDVAIGPADKTGKAMKYRVTVTIPPGTPTSTVDDTIVLESDHPEARELKIPITGFVRGSN